MSDTRIPCEQCSETFTRRSDLRRHVGRKHVPAETITGINPATGKTYTGRIVELTAQDFKRGSWDYYLIKTDQDEEIIVRVERAA